MKWLFHLLLALWAVTGFASVSEANERQLVAGAGPSTMVVQLFFEQFSNHPQAQGIEFLIPARSAKHAGGIKSSDEYLFGRTGRPLSEAERNLGKEEIFLAKVPAVLAVGSEVGISRLSLAQLRSIYLREITRWSQVGGPDAEIVLVGREATEALFSALKKAYPFFGEARFAQVLQKDHQMVNFLKAPEGKFAIGFGAAPNFRDLHLLQIPGFSVGLDVGLVYDLKVQDHPVVKAAAEYSRSAEWRSLVTQIDLLPANN